MTVSIPPSDATPRAGSKASITGAAYAKLVTSTIGSTYATDLDIRWPDSAYARADRDDRVDGKDYALLEANTVTQAQRRFSGPFPDLVDVLPPMK